MLGWLGNLDPYGYYHSQHICEGANNYHGYCDPDTDDLLNDAATEADEDARKDLYDQVAEAVVDANSYIYLYNPSVVQGWGSDVEGYELRPDRAINFETVSLP
jgi:peptide/nickel transport system substrate-binding protein